MEREMLYICSPLRGDVEQNIQNAMRYCEQAIREGYIPIAPHAMYRGIFDDEIPQQRKDALEIGLQLVQQCSRLWVCGDRISAGMQGEIDLAKRLGLPVEEKPAAYFREGVLPRSLTFQKLRELAQETIRSCKQAPDNILTLLDLKAQHHQYSLTNAAAIHAQRPDAKFATTYQEWRKMGFKVTDWHKSIKVWTPVQQQTFLRDGHAVDMRLATRQERESIIKDELPVQERTIYRMDLVYDITQTNCPAASYAQVMNPYAGMDKDTLYASLSAVATKCGFDVRESTDPQVVALKGYCSGDEIAISGKLRTEDKLSELCKAFAQGMVERTSTQPLPVQEFESKAFSYLLHQRFDLPVNDLDKEALVSDFANMQINTTTTPTDCFGYLQKAGNFTMRGVDEEIRSILDEMAPEQTAQKELSQAQREVNKNFMLQIE